MLAITYCSVNLFGLLSGYLKIDRPHHCASIIKIIFQTAFWCFLITAVCLAIDSNRFNGSDLVKNAFPFLSDRLWYISCYIFVFLCSPFLNILASKLTQTEYKKLLIVLTILMSVIPTFTFKDFFHIVNNGYSAGWLMFMYLLGGYYKLYGFNKIRRQTRACICISICVVLMVTSKYVLQLLFSLIGVNIERASQFYHYCSPLTMIISVCFLYVFVSVQIKSRIITKIVLWMSSVSLGIYIIHAHPVSLDNILIGEHLSWMVHENPLLTMIVLFSSVVCIAIVLGFLEQLRIYLFRLSLIDKFLNRIGCKLDDLFDITITAHKT